MEAKHPPRNGLSTEATGPPYVLIRFVIKERCGPPTETCPRIFYMYGVQYFICVKFLFPFPFPGVAKGEWRGVRRLKAGEMHFRRCKPASPESDL